MAAYATSLAPRQGGLRMEVAPIRERPAVRGRHVYTFYAHFHRLGIDGKWKHHGFCREEPRL